MAIPDRLFNKYLEEAADWVKVYPEIAREEHREPIKAIRASVNRVNEIGDENGKFYRLGEQLTEWQRGLREALLGWEQIEALRAMEPDQREVLLYRILEHRAWDSGGP